MKNNQFKILIDQELARLQSMIVDIDSGTLHHAVYSYQNNARKAKLLGRQPSMYKKGLFSFVQMARLISLL